MPAPPLARTYSVTYNGLAITPGAGYGLRGGPATRIEEDSFFFSFFVLIVESTTAAAEAKFQAIEEAFEVDGADFNITLGGYSRDFSEDANTGFDIRAKATHDPESPRNSDRAREYFCTVEGSRPFVRGGEDPGFEGLVSFGYTVDKDASNLRTIRMQGAYTAQPGPPAVSASAQYAAQITTLVDAIHDLIDASANFDNLADFNEFDKRNKVHVFNHLYVENLTDKIVGGGDLDIVDPVIEVLSSTTAPETSEAGISAPVQVTVSYRASIDAERTKALASIFSSKILPRMIEAAKLEAGVGVGAGFEVVAIDPGLNLRNNTIDALLVCRIYANTSTLKIIDSSTDDIQKGLVFVPVHNGNPASVLMYQRIVVATRTRVVGVLVVGGKSKALSVLNVVAPEKAYTAQAVLGAGSPKQTGAPIPPSSAPRFGASGGGWVEVGRTEPTTKRVVGVSPNTVELSSASRTIVSRYVTSPRIREATTGFSGTAAGT